MPVKPLNDQQISAIATHEGIEASMVRTIAEAAVEHDVEPTFLLAVAKRETDFGRGSDYNPTTGLGDRGHGYGIFQLDNRTASHHPLLHKVQHDLSRAANVAAEMLHETLTNGASLIDAAHMYNAGSLRFRSTIGRYEGRTVPYETAVMGWAHEYNTVAQLREHGREPSAAPSPAQTSRAAQDFVNGRIAEAAERFRGMSTRDSATHMGLRNGSLGCAYAVNKVLDAALGRTYGENPLVATSVMADLRRHGTEVDQNHVRPGDIAIKLPSHGELHGHIGIVTRGGEHPNILNNSSRHGSLTNDDSPSAFSKNYVTGRREDRVVFLRIDPASVDLAYARTHPVPEHPLGPANAPPNPTRWDEHRAGGDTLERRQPANHTHTHHTVRRPAVSDATVRNDDIVHGEIRNGHRIETHAELKAKNAIMSEAIRDARAGNALRFHFVGNGRESGREIARQNEKFQHAIEQNLPPGAVARFVGLDHENGHEASLVDRAKNAVERLEKGVEASVKDAVGAAKQWTPEMPFDQFEKVFARLRGGAAQEPSHPAAVQHQTKTPPEHGVDLGR